MRWIRSWQCRNCWRKCCEKLNVRARLLNVLMFSRLQLCRNCPVTGVHHTLHSTVVTCKALQSNLYYIEYILHRMCFYRLYTVHKTLYTCIGCTGAVQVLYTVLYLHTSYPCRRPVFVDLPNSLIWQIFQ